MRVSLESQNRLTVARFTSVCSDKHMLHSSGSRCSYLTWYLTWNITNTDASLVKNSGNGTSGAVNRPQNSLWFGTGDQIIRWVRWGRVYYRASRFWAIVALSRLPSPAERERVREREREKKKILLHIVHVTHSCTPLAKGALLLEIVGALAVPIRANWLQRVGVLWQPPSLILEHIMQFYKRHRFC